MLSTLDLSSHPAVLLNVPPVSVTSLGDLNLSLFCGTHDKLLTWWTEQTKEDLIKLKSR